MKNRITDMPSEEFKRTGNELIEWIDFYLATVEKYRVVPDVKPGDIKKGLPDSMPEKGESFDKIFADFQERILPGITHWQHPNFMAYFNSTCTAPGIFGELISGALNANGMLWKSSPAISELERVTVNWFRDAVGLHKDFWGIIYDTASISTMHAIANAKEKIRGYAIREKGLVGSGVPPLRLYSSEFAHSSVEKGALTLGLGLEGTHKIGTDEKFQMIPSELEKAIQEDINSGYKPFCVVATVGTTSVTSIDPVKEITAICKKYDLWLHIDAAHAGVIAMIPGYEYILDSVDKADSIVINPHKWGFVPMDCSLFFTKQPDLLKKAFSIVPEYLKTKEDSEVENLMDYGVQLGRRFRSLKLWFVLRYYGKEGYIEIYKEHLRLGKLFEKLVLKDSRFELMAPVTLSTICFRGKPIGMSEEELNAFNESMISSINDSGKLFLSHTKLNGKYVVRLVISGIRTEENHVLNAWEIIKNNYELSLT
ncbi:MAG: pyridoxal-dependent decarboxylase [Melioribacteraceae bacterium]|nr:pyridoxal-dependent decarboxylase [Melioribacteraceae bacterium]